MVILLQQIISGRQVKKVTSLTVRKFTDSIQKKEREREILFLGDDLFSTQQYILQQQFIFIRHKQVVLEYSVPYQNDPFYNQLHFSTEGPFVPNTQQVKPSGKTKKVIRVLALLFKKQDYNRYYLDRHPLGDLEYQYKKEENPRQLRVVIDLHKSHIDFFFVPWFYSFAASFLGQYQFLLSHFQPKK